MRIVVRGIGRFVAVFACALLVASTGLAAITLSPARGVLSGIAPGATVKHALAVSCQGGTSQPCISLDPSVTGCSVNAMDERAMTTPHGYTLVLRWSSACGAIWAKITGAPALTFFEVRSTTGQGTESYRVPSGSSSGFTNMVDDQPPNQAVACGDGVCTGAW